jgi:enolase
MMNVVNGGAHADNNLDIQEFAILLGRRRRSGRVETFHALKGGFEKKISNAVATREASPEPKSHERRRSPLAAIEKAQYRPEIR